MHFLPMVSLLFDFFSFEETASHDHYKRFYNFYQMVNSFQYLKNITNQRIFKHYFNELA